MKTIINIAESYLDGNGLDSNFEIISQIEETSVSHVEVIGKFTLRNKNGGDCYLIEYQSLVPLHGSGVDDLNVITNVTQTK